MTITTTTAEYLTQDQIGKHVTLIDLGGCVSGKLTWLEIGKTPDKDGAHNWDPVHVNVEIFGGTYTLKVSPYTEVEITDE